MKNQITFSSIAKAKVAFAGLFACLVLSAQVHAQVAPTCNAHFIHHQFMNSATVDFDPGFNPFGSTYLWTFGDGDSSAAIAPNHVYAQSGTYYACLTVTKTDSNNAVVCTDSWCDSIQFTLPPPPPPPVCNAQFAHHSYMNGVVDFDHANNPQGASYSWDFGDNSTSTAGNVNHIYAAAGVYYACLTVSDSDPNGNVLCSDTWCDSVHVTSAPPPPPPLCNAHYHFHHGHGMTVYFNAPHNSVGTTFAWDFGDSSTDSVANATHTYAAAGTYNACLTVTTTDSNGVVICTDNWCDSIFIAPPPVPCHPQFSAIHSHHSGLSVFFAAAHNSPNVTYSWDFGDGGTATGRDTTYTYALPGTYNVCLTVTNTDTNNVVICTATWCDSVRVDTNHVTPHPQNHCDNNNHNNGPHRLAYSSSLNALEAAVVNIYPNPVTDLSVLHIENATGNVSFKIFESTGRLIISKENLSNGDFDLNKSEFKSGIYFYQVSDDNGNMINGKIVVQ